MPVVQRISPCLWFDSEAEEAATRYTVLIEMVTDRDQAKAQKAFATLPRRHRPLVE